MMPSKSKANETKKETLGFVSGDCTKDLKLQTFDPELNKWSYEDIPPPPTDMCEYSAMVTDRKLIIAGGSLNGSWVDTNIVECMDLKTKEWTSLPPLRQGRSYPGMAELNGDLYIVGGLLDNGQWARSVEKYDFRTCKWEELAPMYSEHDCVIVAVLGELLYAGNSSIECFNPAKNEWTQLPHKNERLSNFGLAGLGGYLYAVGGEQNGQDSKTVERFHPSTNTWTVVTPGLGLALSSLTCVAWNNRLIAGGGFSQFSSNSSVVEYNPEENEWKSLGSLVEHDISSASLFTFKK